MLQISPEAFEEVRRALKRYEAEVEASSLTLRTKWTYIRHASTFVRWVGGEFKPGASKEKDDVD